MFIQQKRGLSVSPPIIITCELCNTLENLDECNPPGEILRIMSKRNVCSNCAFWMDKIAHPDIGNEVIGSHYYIVYPFVKRPNNVIKGSEGKEFYIRRFDGTLIKSNNIWHQGEIPEHFRKQLPDTANFLSLITYTKLSNDSHKCHAKGCWDRYNCLRYNLSCERDGPFNKIPANHTIGDENCPSFININELKI
ncbi:hypothetical protein [Bacteroides ovatus]|uniref:Uncharacterized protein n=2 Tax=Bacteroides TaxID=816 RepID=A0AAP3WKW9_BACOV|nr:hypothetical protein [Bacteroides ovatus]MDC2372779.1 hypothetical protein [Bacteroides ovatus]MDC2409723.1 hypothetical protein [Bacteroides ovatus]MDC2415508.1 hypothetical protein [Bacteroides ovatus]OFK48666.1 hypothetical protein HMPREF2815_09260 [Bacteroides sp. HMSC068A09]